MSNHKCERCGQKRVSGTGVIGKCSHALGHLFKPCKDDSPVCNCVEGDQHGKGCAYYQKNKGLLKVNMSIVQMQARIHQQNREMGWWDNPREMGTLLCLVHSEISEAMEGERKGLMDDHLPHRPMLEVELADAMIRIMDIAASRDLDLAGAIVEKVDYNRKRVDHQPGARAGTYGKKF